MSNLQDPRVLFAAERTLLAWTRTSLALIAFGFMIERAGLLLRAISPGQMTALDDAGMFWLGLAFILLGASTVVYSSRQYALLLHTLNPAEFPPGYRPKWGLWVNVVVGVLGLGLLVLLYIARLSRSIY